MSSQEFLATPEPSQVKLPLGDATVTLRVIDTIFDTKIKITCINTANTTRLTAPIKFLVEPEMPGFETVLSVPSYAFLISHGDRHILFDLGLRKDWENLSPTSMQVIKTFFNSQLQAPKDIVEILDEHATEVGVSSKDIEAVVWSHQHWDHIGDMTTFPPSTDVLVGPGFIKQYGPGYPANPDSELLESDFAGRQVREVDFTASQGTKVGSLPAIDYFGDGSFLLLDAPGHTCGHLCGLVRVSTSPASFVLLGGDAAHHPSIIKPNNFNPLPRTIDPSPIPGLPGGCPGEFLRHLQPRQNAAEPFFKANRGIHYNPDDLQSTVQKIQEVAALDNVLMIIAHDLSLLPHLPLFPKPINDWYSEDLARKTRWNFCQDFGDAVKLSQSDNKL